MTITPGLSVTNYTYHLKPGDRYPYYSISTTLEGDALVRLARDPCFCGVSNQIALLNCVKQEPPYQARFAAYSAAHRKDPGQMLAHDEQAWPDDCMTGFVLWLGEQWDRWRQRERLERDQKLSKSDNLKFDGYLRAVYLPSPSPIDESALDGSNLLSR